MNITIEETLTGIANQLRIDSIAAPTCGQAAAIPRRCSAGDLVAALFFGHMRAMIRRTRGTPTTIDLFWSKGHAAPLLYAAWAELGTLSARTPEHLA